uniref:Transposase n=1 Tax=Panagrellus redivivus TaxID=6233 RepID=A0A7E4URI8_PANRE
MGAFKSDEGFLAVLKGIVASWVEENRIECDASRQMVAVFKVRRTAASFWWGQSAGRGWQGAIWVAKGVLRDVVVILD